MEDALSGRILANAGSFERFWANSSRNYSFDQNIMNYGFSVPAVPSRLLIFFLLVYSLWLNEVMFSVDAIPSHLLI